MATHDETVTGGSIRHAALLDVLAILSSRARENTGWQRRGIRGWMFTDEFGKVAFAADGLTAAAARGLVSREDVLDPGRKLPLYINRITQGGENLLASHRGREALTIPAPRRRLTAADAETLYLPSGAWTGLRVMASNPNAEEWIPAARLGPGFFAEDREFLRSRQLAEVLRPTSGRANAPLLYRATALGRGARALDTTTSADRVQIRVKGATLRAPVPASGRADSGSAG